MRWGLCRFVRDPAGLPESGGGAGPAVWVGLPTGAVRLAGVPGRSLTCLERLFGKADRAGSGAAASLRVVPVDGSAFREAAEIDWEPFLAVEYGRGGIAAAGFRWMLELDRAGAGPMAGSVWIDREAEGSTLEDLWENVLRITAAYTALAGGGLLVHSAAAAVGEPADGFLLPAASGGGKSTVAALLRSEGAVVLSDDCNAVLPSPSSQGFELACLPFGGELRPRRCPEGRFPLRGVLVLEKGPRTGGSPVEPSAAVGRLVASAQFVNGDPHLAGTVLERASAIVAAVWAGRLEFSLDGGVAGALGSLARMIPR